MKVSDFDYDLPEELIAKHPPKVRGTSRLLVLNRADGTIHHALYSELPNFLNSGDIVVRNDTQVIKARLLTENNEGKRREILLLENHGTQDVLMRKVLYRGTIHPNETLKIGPHQLLVVEILGGGEAIISAETSLLEIAAKFGEVPLPPYMHRQASKEDEERYQTVFANNAGSVAAPTASLNFTKSLEDTLHRKGIHTTELTLHVGLGTFLPIRTETLENHKMHSEFFVVPKTTISAISSVKSCNNRVIAVGTTVTRTLEFCADKLARNIEQDLSGEAEIFIYPGYKFNLVNGLLTNFHAPKSTVLMMAAAFAGWDNLKHAYEEAIKENYAFLSYGDSMLII